MEPAILVRTVKYESLGCKEEGGYTRVNLPLPGENYREEEK